MVLTIALIAFLMLILVSLSVVLKVETGSASSEQKVAMARRNALLGLETAIGRLQQYAGPDQRVTGTASIKGATNNPYWTGVWKRNTLLAKTDAIPEWQDAQLLTWLVSGNTEADPLKYLPTVDLPTTPALIPLLSSPDSSNQRISVVPENVGPINSNGLAEGRFAYWVADESVKARVNIGRETVPATPSHLVEAINQWISAPPGISKMVDLNALALSPAPETPATGQPNQWNKLTSTDQLNLIHSAAGDVVRKKHFHDLTTSSVGLFTDTQFGGLKKDLSLAFEMTKPDFNSDAFFSSSGTNPAPLGNKYGLVYSKFGTDTLIGPTWQKLHDFYLLYSQVANYSINGVADLDDLPVPVTDTGHQNACDAATTYTDNNTGSSANNVFRTASNAIRPTKNFRLSKKNCG